MEYVFVTHPTMSQNIYTQNLFNFVFILEKKFLFVSNNFFKTFDSEATDENLLLFNISDKKKYYIKICNKIDAYTNRNLLY